MATAQLADADLFHSCTFVEEVRLADCEAGCKVRKCTGCFREAAVHDDPCDGWRTLNGPSLATLHRKWLDRGLPAHTWTTFIQDQRDYVL